MNKECQETTQIKKKNEQQDEAEEKEKKERERRSLGSQQLQQQQSCDKPLTMSADKAVSTYGIQDLEDYQRAVTYELVFHNLLEKKMLAMKKECEDRKRAKRLKRKSIGRIFFAKRLFSSMDSRKTSDISEMVTEEVHAKSAPSTPQKTMKSLIEAATKEQTEKPRQRKIEDIEIETAFVKATVQRSTSLSLCRTRSKSKINTASQELPTPETLQQNPQQQEEQQHQQQQQQADDSLTSTLSNSSGKVVVKQNLLVTAQTHRAQDTPIVSSSSGDSKTAQTSQSIANQTLSIVAPLSLERTQDNTSLASGYENGTGARLHSSTMADGSLTSIRDSIESLSFASSRCTVSFGATEVIPQDIDVNIIERIKAAKRQRILEAKSISAQCSPILQPRHIIKTLVHAAPISPTNQLKQIQQPILNMEQVIATTASSLPAETGTSIKVTQPRFLPNQQYSYTDSVFESRNISRQNTSEDSANLTVSTLLNQSDSLSLHAPVAPGGQRTILSISDRFKSKSTSLLAALGNGRTRPPPLPPPPFETAQHSPVAVYSPTTILAPHALPIEQLQQLHLAASNIRYNRAKSAHATSSTSKPHTHTPTSSKAVSKTAQSLQTINVTTAGAATLPHRYPLDDALDTHSYTITTTTTTASTLPFHTTSLTATTRNGDVVNGAIAASTLVNASDTAKLHRMTSTSTASSIGPTTTGCCTTTKTTSRIKEKQRFKPQLALGQSGSDDEYRKKKRKYKRYHRCSDPVLVYPTPSGLQHCILSMPPNDSIQYPYTEDYAAYDVQLQMESDKNDDLEKIVPSDSTKRKHHKHRHHRHKKRHRHKKTKILLQDLETHEVKVIDPDDLPQRARWTIIATACLLLLMCLMLVGITLRMAPIIDDMVRQENERLMKETMDRARFGKNYTETASSLLAATTSTLAAAAAAAAGATAGGAHQQQHNQQQILLPQPQQYPLPHLQQIP